MNSQTPAGSEDISARLAVLGEALRTACVELMTEYGLEAHLEEAPERASLEPVPSVLTASVDFDGEALQGTLELRASRSVVVSTTQNAPGLRHAAPPNLGDWTCELANQLVGRMKNKLRGYKVPINVGVPRDTQGTAPPKHGEGVHYRFTCDCGILSGYIDVRFAPGFSFGVPELDPNLPDEGDVVLF